MDQSREIRPRSLAVHYPNTEAFANVTRIVYSLEENVPCNYLTKLVYSIYYNSQQTHLAITAALVAVSQAVLLCSTQVLPGRIIATQCYRHPSSLQLAYRQEIVSQCTVGKTWCRVQLPLDADLGTV